MKATPFERLPTSVEIDGVSHPINYDFRFCVLLEMEATSGAEPDVAGLLERFYINGVPADVNAAADKMLEFYAGYSAGSKTEQEKQNGRGRQYDYEQDADVLIASFLDCYGIDLMSINLHWWTFRRLMLSLPDASPFMQRVKYRVADISKLDKNTQRHYRKMKSLYAIRDKKAGEPVSAEERDAALVEKVARRFEEAKKAVEKR